MVACYLIRRGESTHKLGLPRGVQRRRSPSTPRRTHGTAERPTAGMASMTTWRSSRPHNALVSAWAFPEPVEGTQQADDGGHSSEWAGARHKSAGGRDPRGLSARIEKGAYLVRTGLAIARGPNGQCGFFTGEAFAGFTEKNPASHSWRFVPVGNGQLSARRPSFAVVTPSW